MMRIVAGSHRGRVLKTPEGQEIRPTSDKVRQAIFNVLSSHCGINGLRVLDLFCGTGALGLEALSQGAADCTFLDISPVSLALAKENARNLGLLERCTFLQRDAVKIGVRPNSLLPFDLDFLDAPYHKNLSEQCFCELIEGNWLKNGAIMVVETGKEDVLSGISGKIWAEKVYGLTKVTFLSYNLPGTIVS